MPEKTNTVKKGPRFLNDIPFSMKRLEDAKPEDVLDVKIPWPTGPKNVAKPYAYIKVARKDIFENKSDSTGRTINVYLRGEKDDKGIERITVGTRDRDGNQVEKNLTANQILYDVRRAVARRNNFTASRDKAMQDAQSQNDVQAAPESVPAVKQEPHPAAKPVEKQEAIPAQVETAVPKAETPATPKAERPMPSVSENMTDAFAAMEEYEVF